jgi:signal transduction histidine kinase/CheY-like chemotaxis protein
MEISDLERWCIYAFKYYPMLMTASLCGTVPAMICALIVFAVKCMTDMAFSYMTCIYLVASIIIIQMNRKKWFRLPGKSVLAALCLMFVLGDAWGVALGLAAGRGLAEIQLRKMVLYFLNEGVGCGFTAASLYVIVNYTPKGFKHLFNGMLPYLGEEKQTRQNLFIYEQSDESKLGSAVTRIVVIEAAVLGIFAAISANTLIPFMMTAQTGDGAVQEENVQEWDSITTTMELEKKVSEMVSGGTLGGTPAFMVTLAFDARLMMLIIDIIIPMAVFANHYALWRIVVPIREMSDAVKRFVGASEDAMIENAEKIHTLGIHTGDEIEDLYHNFDDTATKTVNYIRDIQEGRKLENDLKVAKAASDAKSTFLSNVSHEIRTPINAVLGFDEMIIRESKDHSIIEYARNIQNSGKTLLSLINDILDFSKIEAGKMEIVPVEYELSSVINDLVNMTLIKAKAKNLQLSVDMDENIPHVLIGDEIRIKQCVMNLLNNAVKYTDRGEVGLKVMWKRLDDDLISLKFEVSDTGTGLTQEQIKKMFDPFERLDEARNRTIEGTGLGMNIVRQLLDLMGTELQVYSEKGVGSMFSFALEQKVVVWEAIGNFNQTYEESLAALAPYREKFHAPEARILVVDDTHTNLTVFRGLLKNTQAQIDAVESGRAALDMVREKKYDMIFLDHRMPEMDGIETLHAMQQMDDNLNRTTPVIALTANVVSGARERYFQEGFSGYLAKPVSGEHLEEMVLNWLPEQLVIHSNDPEFREENSSEKHTDSELVSSLLRITDIDINSAIENCGGVEMVPQVIEDFWLSIDEKAHQIEIYEKTDDIEKYTILVHGLKSSARAIGALSLSEKAAALEKAGNESDMTMIREDTPQLLELYRSYKEKLREVAESGDTYNKRQIEPEELESALSSLREFVEASYFDSADDVMKLLAEYKIPEEFEDKYEQIRRLMAAVDRDGLLKLLQKTESTEKGEEI